MADYFEKSRHHLSVVDPVTSDTLGFVLARKNGQLAYAELDGKYLADQIFTNTPSQEYTEPEREIILYQDDFRAGFGQYSMDDSKKYHKSFGMDLSVEGQGMAGWNSTAITLPTFTATDEANLDWETWSDASTPGTWTEDQALTRSTTAHGGTYSGMIEWTTGTWTLVASQSVTWTTEYQGREFFLRGWGRSEKNFASGDGAVKFAIFDGTDRTYSGVCGNTAANTWTQSTWAKHSVNASGSELTIEVYVKGDGSTPYDMFFDDMEFIDPTNGAIVAHAEFADDLWFSMGNNLIKINDTNGAVGYKRSFPATITALQPFQISGADYLIIFLGTSNAYWYMSTAESFTESTATDKTYQFGAWVNTTVDTLYANDGDNTLRSTINPLNGGTAWSAQTIVGSAADAITHLQEKDGALLIDKEDMPYYLDSSGNVKKDLAPECVSGKSTHSGKNSTLWQGEYYRPTGDQALLNVGTTNEWIQPSKYGVDISEFSGQVEACAGDEEWLYVATDNSTLVELLKTREQVIDGATKRVWHPFHELTLTGVETMWISTVYKKRLYITSTSASDSLYYLPLPTKYGDITSDDNRTFKTGTYFETSYLHGGFNGDQKAYIKMTMELGHAYDADIYFTAHYKKIGDVAWTEISPTNKFKGTSANRLASAYIPVDASSNKPTSTQMKFKITAVTDDTNKTPILLNYKVSAVLYPTIRRLIYCMVRVGDGVLDKNGIALSNKTVLQKTCLDNARSATYPVTFTDIDGTSRTGKFLPLPSSTERRVPIKDEKGRPMEFEYNLLILVTETS